MQDSGSHSFDDCLLSTQPRGGPAISRFPKSISLAAVLPHSVYLSSLGDAKEGQPQFKPMELSGGPLLSFVHPEDENGKSQPGGGERLEVFYLFDPVVHKKPQAIMREDIHSPRLVGRVSKNIVVWDYKSQLFTANLAKGTISPLLQEKGDNVLVAIESDRIYFLKRLVSDSMHGVELNHREDGKSVPRSWFRARDVLYEYKIDRSTPARPVSPLVFEHFFEAAPDGFWGITSESPHKVVRIDRKGTVHEEFDLGADWVLWRTVHQFSPTRRYLALSFNHREQDFPSNRTLLICDLQEKRIAYQDRKVSVPQGLSMSPSLSLNWLNDSLLRYDVWFSGGVVDAQKSEKLDQAAAAKFLHRLPNEPADKFFRWEKGGLLYFAGGDEPVANVLDGDVIVGEITISPDEKWAASDGTNGAGVTFIDGVKKKKRVIIDGWGYQLHWLPSSE